MSDLVFQAIAWHAEDMEVDDDDNAEGDEQDTDPVDTLEPPAERYLIKAFGKDIDGNKVALTVRGFTPYFYIRLPTNWGRRQVEPILEAIRIVVGRSLASSVLQARFVQKKDLWGFTNGTLFGFVRIDFASYKAYRTAWYRLDKGITVLDVPPPSTGWVSGVPKGVKFTVYEANIDPFIRFMHLRDIQPCGWVSVDKDNLSTATVMLASAKDTLDYETQWRNVIGADVEGAAAAPFSVASFDIECTSSHGDFPVPVKDYRKPAQELTELAYVMCGEKSTISDIELTRRITAELRQAFDLPTKDTNANFLGKIHTKQPLTPKQVSTLDAAAEDFAVILRKAHKEGRDTTVQSLLTKLKALKLPDLQGDPIIQIGITVHKYGSQEVNRKIILVWGGCEHISNDIEVRTYTTEADLLMGFRDAMQEVDPDIVTGYNILGFDFWYLVERAKELGVLYNFMTLGRLKDHNSVYVEKKLSSSALGDNLLRYVEMDGRVMLDVMKVVQRDHKLDSYKLDAVASHFLKSNKHDVSPADIFRLQRGSDADRARIAAYCVQDCELCNRLIIKLETLANNIGMANVCLVPLNYIFMRGQGIKIFSLVLKQAKDDGFLVPVIRPAFRPKTSAVSASDVDAGESDSFEGAIVLEPQVGIYTDMPVSVFDYASLYPSSMISENLSQDTIVLDSRNDNLPGVEYIDVSYDVYSGEGDKKVKVGERVCRFAQPRVGKDGKEIGRGLMPRILQKLLQARKSTRKMIEQTDDPFQKAVLDGLQLAYKITANSLYGQCGARTSPVYMKDIAACTTATGRRMILKAKEFLEKNYCAQIVYGDSVASYTPIIARYMGNMLMDTVEGIGATIGRGNWKQCFEDGRQTKEYVELDGLEVWSDDGWTPALRLIRHALAPHKRIVRVTTHTGVVDVTDDHSLLRSDKSVVKPGELRRNELLLHADLPEYKGQCGIADVDAAVSLALGLGQGDAVPMTILGASEELRLAFWNALRRNRHWMREMSEIQLRAAFAYILLQPETTSDELVTVCDIPNYSGYVYDFTTANHHFAAGVGRLVVHNTDSLFCVFPHDGSSPYVIKERGHAAIAPSIQIAMKAQQEFKQHLRAPHDLQYEKTFWPFILLSKKRYVGNLYEDDDVHFKQKSMGIVLKRRDNAPIVKRVYGGIIDVLLNRQDINASVDFLKSCLKELAECRTPVDDLVVTKCLRSDYADPDRIAHKVLADRMALRDPGNKPQTNDRIPYMYIQLPRTKRNAKVLQGDRIEHPDYVRDKGLKPDTHFYITNQVMRPVLQLYATVVERLPGFRKPAGHYNRLLAKLIHSTGDERKAKEKLMAHKEEDVQKLLFEPTLTKLANARDGNGEITSFFSVSKKV